MLILFILLACVPSRPESIPEHVVPTQNPNTLRMAVVGDIGKPGSKHLSVATAISDVCSRQGCDLVVVTGDNVYPRGAQGADDPTLAAVMAPYLQLDLPVMLVLGNHDWGHGFDEEAANAQLAYMKQHANLIMPATDYVVRAGPATLAAVDTTRVFWDGQSWRRGWLREVFQETTTQWSVLVGHHPFRSDGVHGHAGRYEGWPYVPWLSGMSLERLFNEIVCHQADLYLSGHDHSLQHLRHCGRDLVVSGAGASTTPISEQGEREWGSQALGFAWVELGSTRKIAFYDHSGETLHTSTE